MNGMFLLVWLVTAQIPAIQVMTLAGDEYQGTLESFSSESAIVKTDIKSITVPLGELLLIRSTTASPQAADDSTLIEIRLVDNTRMRVNSLTTSGTTASVVHPRLGELQIPISIISSVRFASLDPKIEPEWNQLLDRTIKKDVVAVRKGDVLDHLDGVIGSLNKTTMQFQLDGDDIPIKREKIFGLIYSKRDSLAKRAIGQLLLVTGDRLALRQVAWSGTSWKAKLASGPELEIPAELFQSLDYSVGKVSYLSDMKPRSVEHEEFHAIKDVAPPFVFRDDMDFNGKSIRLYESPQEIKSYSKGLAIHSQTLLKYRLGGEYRRFQAIMGIDAEVPWGGVGVEIRGDRKTLFKQEIVAMDTVDGRRGQRAKPKSIDLDVTNVVDLEIFVAWGSNEKDADGQTIRPRQGGGCLNLANARLIK